MRHLTLASLLLLLSCRSHEDPLGITPVVVLGNEIGVDPLSVTSDPNENSVPCGAGGYGTDWGVDGGGGLGGGGSEPSQGGAGGAFACVSSPPSGDGGACR